MQGTDLGAIAQNFITYFGGAAGGYIVAAALLISLLLTAIHVTSHRTPMMTLICGCLAWGSAYLVRNTLGWA